MSTRRQAKPKKIEISNEEREKWTRLLLDYYGVMKSKPFSFENYKKGKGELNLSESELLVKFVGFIVQACEDGWPRAPKEFEKRISYKSGWNNPIRVKKSSKIFSSEEDSGPSHDVLDFKNNLLGNEREFFDFRIKQYFDDFEFNESSDKPLVERLVIEEIIYRRLMIIQLEKTTGKKAGDTGVGDALSSSHKRMSELQKQLGISRMQRADEMNRGVNSVAEMAMNLDEKLKKYPKLREKLEEEENRFLDKKKEMVPINYIPPQDQLENLLSNADETKIYEGIVDDALIQPEKKEEEKLAEGINLG